MTPRALTGFFLCALACSESPAPSAASANANPNAAGTTASTSAGSPPAAVAGTTSGGTSPSGNSPAGTTSAGTTNAGTTPAGTTNAGTAQGGALPSNAGTPNGGESAGAPPEGGSPAGGTSASGGTSPGGTSAGGSATSGAGGMASGGEPEAAGGAGAGGSPEQTTEPPQLLVFSRTVGYRHASIPDGIAALTALSEERGWQLTATEDSTQFSDATLSQIDVVIFLSTTDDVLDETQQAAFERFIQAGGGYVGIHAASDTEYDWPWYGGLVGAYFKAHPDIQQASIRVEDPSHSSTAHLVDPWVRTDEWYGFTENPRPQVNVLLTLDESSYSPGDGSMGDDHPIAWYHEYDGGRAFYTALGHTSESYSEPEFIQHLAGGIEWALGQ